MEWNVRYLYIITFQLDAEFPAFISRMAELSHLLTVVNSSANLYIYLMKHHSMNTMAAMLCKKGRVEADTTDFNLVRLFLHRHACGRTQGLVLSLKLLSIIKEKEIVSMFLEFYISRTFTAQEILDNLLRLLKI